MGVKRSFGVGVVAVSLLIGLLGVLAGVAGAASGSSLIVGDAVPLSGSTSGSTTEYASCVSLSFCVLLQPSSSNNEGNASLLIENVSTSTGTAVDSYSFPESEVDVGTGGTLSCVADGSSSSTIPPFPIACALSNNTYNLVFFTISGSSSSDVVVKPYSVASGLLNADCIAVNECLVLDTQNDGASPPYIQIFDPETGTLVTQQEITVETSNSGSVVGLDAISCSSSMQCVILGEWQTGTFVDVLALPSVSASGNASGPFAFSTPVALPGIWASTIGCQPIPQTSCLLFNEKDDTYNVVVYDSATGSLSQPASIVAPGGSSSSTPIGSVCMSNGYCVMEAEVTVSTSSSGATTNNYFLNAYQVVNGSEINFISQAELSTITSSSQLESNGVSSPLYCDGADCVSIDPGSAFPVTLEVPTLSVSPGSFQWEPFSTTQVTLSAEFPEASGTVTFTEAGESTPLCSNVALNTSGAASCQVPVSQFQYPGPYNLSASSGSSSSLDSATVQLSATLTPSSTTGSTEVASTTVVIEQPIVTFPQLEVFLSSNSSNSSTPVTTVSWSAKGSVLIFGEVGVGEGANERQAESGTVEALLPTSGEQPVAVLCQLIPGIFQCMVPITDLLATMPLDPTKVPITVQYSFATQASDFVPAAQTVVDLTVVPPPMTLQADPSSVSLFQGRSLEALSLTATVPAAQGVTDPGSVTFSDGAGTLCSSLPLQSNDTVLCDVFSNTFFPSSAVSSNGTITVTATFTPSKGVALPSQTATATIAVFNSGSSGGAGSVPIVTPPPNSCGNGFAASSISCGTPEPTKTPASQVPLPTVSCATTGADNGTATPPMEESLSLKTLLLSNEPRFSSDVLGNGGFRLPNNVMVNLNDGQVPSVNIVVNTLTIHGETLSFTAQGSVSCSSSGSATGSGSQTSVLVSYGSPQSLGFTGLSGSKPLAAPIVNAVATSNGGGYWLVATDSGVFAFGDAKFYGNGYTDGLTGLGGPHPLAAPIVDLVPTINNQGYWLLGADGGVFAFGDAAFFGSSYTAGLSGLHGPHPLAAPIVDLVPTSNDQGYWLLGADGGVFAFGNAPYCGSLPEKGIHTDQALYLTPSVNGYSIQVRNEPSVSFSCSGGQ